MHEMAKLWYFCKHLSASNTCIMYLVYFYPILSPFAYCHLTILGYLE